jgi:S-adenosylmethionine:tRNA ribosyltransferase-isomerase
MALTMDLNKRSTYSFELPESLIAAYPLEKRSDARLMVIRKNTYSIEHYFVHDLAKILPENAMLVANNTKVFRARLTGTRVGSAGKVEFFLLKKLDHALWQGLIRSSARVTSGFQFAVGNGVIETLAVVVDRKDTNAGTLFTVKLSDDPVALNLGEVPLPPYITTKRGTQVTGIDELETYNTTFAKQEGSVAAPTAGRHFTKELIKELKSKKIDWQEITLHVGMGTFKPVTVDQLSEHLMHAESSFIAEETARSILLAKKENKSIIAIGTTSTRTLEGRAVRNPQGQVELPSGEKDVNLFIHPSSGHEWKLVDGILTNFHLPESTLFMMIATFVGDVDFLKKAYQTAIDEKYRFYSYGDAMLIL